MFAVFKTIKELFVLPCGKKKQLSYCMQQLRYFSSFSDENNAGLLLQHWRKQFQSAKIPEPNLAAKYIMEHIIGRKQVAIGIKNNVLTKDQVTAYNELCQKRLQRMPVQYIIGEWDFRHITLTMKPPVFIARPSTEILVGLVLDHHLKGPDSKPISVLEVGCGSGAISLSMLSESPKVTCTALDKHKHAVDLTLHNAKTLNLLHRLEIFNVDIASLFEMELEKRFDVLVSNPPYVSSHDMKTLDPEILKFEDLNALHGGHDGLSVIKEILFVAQFLLHDGGSVWLEVDSPHPPLIKEFLETQSHLNLHFVNSITDCEDSHARYCHLVYRDRVW